MEIKVYYEDTDCGGVVYYANYLRYFERVRTEYLESRGVSLADYQRNGVVFTVVDANIKYNSPARYGDTIMAEAVVDDVRKSSFTVKYILRRKHDDCMLVTGSTRMACVNDRLKPIRIPEEIRRVL